MKNFILFICLILSCIIAHCQTPIPTKFSALPVQAIDTGSYTIGIENSLGAYTNCRYKLPPAIDTTSLSNRINTKTAFTDTATVTGTKYDVDTADKNTRLYAAELVGSNSLSNVLSVGNTATNGIILNDGDGDQANITGSNISSSLISGGISVFKLELEYNQFGFTFTSGGYSNSTFLQFINPSAEREIVFPDASGVVCLANDSAIFSSTFRTDSSDENVRIYVQTNYIPWSDTGNEIGTIDDVDTASANVRGYVQGLSSHSTCTLSSGTVTVSVAACKSTSFIAVQLKSPGVGPNGAQYKVAPGTGTFVVTAVGTTGSTVTTDASTLSYFIVY